MSQQLTDTKNYYEVNIDECWAIVAASVNWIPTSFMWECGNGREIDIEVNADNTVLIHPAQTDFYRYTNKEPCVVYMRKHNICLKAFSNPEVYYEAVKNFGIRTIAIVPPVISIDTCEHYSQLLSINNGKQLKVGKLIIRR